MWFSGSAPSNDPIPVDTLPRLGDDAWVPVDPKHAVGSVATTLFLAVAVIVGTGLVASRQDSPWVAVTVGVGIAVLLTLSSVWSWMAARRVAYQLREHDVSLRHGLLTRNEATIPFRRIQHVDVSRGVLDRSLGLASLAVNSAGPDIEIPGLTNDTAQQLRAFVVDRATLDDAER